VMKPVMAMPSTCDGYGQQGAGTPSAQVGIDERSAPYAASRPPNDMASPARKIHIASFDQLSGVNGFWYVSTVVACPTAAAWLMTIPLLPLLTAAAPAGGGGG